MDAFAIAVCKGMGLARRDCIKAGIIAGIYFGVAQALMPVAGYLLGTGLSGVITAVSRYVALALLSIIGLQMIRESRKQEAEDIDASLSVSAMLPMAIATSIDAAAVGVTFAASRVNIVIPAMMIGMTTFMFSFVGAAVGSTFGSKLGNRAKLAGGIILICIGIKIFVTG